MHAGNLMKAVRPPRRCGARTRQGTRCRKWGMSNGRCRLHGGLTPRGLASPHFRHGRYSRDWLTVLAVLYGGYRRAMETHVLHGPAG